MGRSFTVGCDGLNVNIKTEENIILFAFNKNEKKNSVVMVIVVDVRENQTDGFGLKRLLLTKR